MKISKERIASLYSGIGYNANDPKEARAVLLEVLNAVSPLPAAADRGVPGQRVSDARMTELQAEYNSDEHGDFCPTPNEVSWLFADLRDCRAEIARLTDAGPTFADAVAVVRRWRDKWAETYTDRNDEFAGTERVAAETIIRDLEALASEKRS